MPSYPGVPVIVVDGNGNQIIPRVAGLSALPLAIQAHDPTGGPYAMCQYLSGGAPIKSSDNVILFPGAFTHGNANDLFSQLSNIHRIPTWFNWLGSDNLVAGTNGVTTTAFSAETATVNTPSTQPYPTLTGLTTNDRAAWNPEPAHTAAAEVASSAQATVMAQAIADGITNNPAFDVWWVPLSSAYTTLIGTVGPLVTNAIFQAQNIPQSSWLSSVQAAISAGHAANASLKVWVQGIASPTSGFFGNLQSLALAGTLPDGIVILTETSATPSYLTDLQTLVNQLRN